MKLSLSAMIVIVSPILTPAQDSLGTRPDLPAMNFGPGIAEILFKLVISLVVIIGLIYGSIFLLRKISNRTLPQANQWVKVIGRSYLTPKQSLYIVKMGQKFAVLGVGDSSINLIKELTPEEAESLNVPTDKPREFAGIFKNLLKK